MVAERTRSRPLPGTQHFINPKRIPADEDFVALSGFGSLVRWLAVAAAIASMFLAVYLIFDGASGIGSGTVHRLFDLATNPVIGLLIGIVATATIQSSTTVTALTVAAVGTGSLQVAVALPIILGANVGTTLTSLIVSFGVIYNGARIALSERSRSLATLRVLGFTRREVTTILLSELGLLTLLSIGPGLLLGTWMAKSILESVDTETMRFPLILGARTYVVAVLTVFVSTVFSFVVVGRRIAGLDLLAVLKSAE